MDSPRSRQAARRPRIDHRIEKGVKICDAYGGMKVNPAAVPDAQFPAWKSRHTIRIRRRRRTECDGRPRAPNIVIGIGMRPAIVRPYARLVHTRIHGQICFGELILAAIMHNLPVC